MTHKKVESSPRMEKVLRKYRNSLWNLAKTRTLASNTKSEIQTEIIQIYVTVISAALTLL